MRTENREKYDDTILVGMFGRLIGAVTPMITGSIRLILSPDMVEFGVKMASNLINTFVNVFSRSITRKVLYMTTKTILPLIMKYLNPLLNILGSILNVMLDLLAPILKIVDPLLKDISYLIKLLKDIGRIIGRVVGITIPMLRNITGKIMGTIIAESINLLDRLNILYPLVDAVAFISGVILDVIVRILETVGPITITISSMLEPLIKLINPVLDALRKGLISFFSFST